MERQGKSLTKTIFSQVVHKGKTVSSAAHNKTFNTLKSSLTTSDNFDVGYIPIGYAGRPDRISNAFYGTPDYWWLIMLANRVIDPVEDLKVNQKIVIPRI